MDQNVGDLYTDESTESQMLLHWLGEHRLEYVHRIASPGQRQSRLPLLLSPHGHVRGLVPIQNYLISNRLVELSADRLPVLVTLQKDMAVALLGFCQRNDKTLDQLIQEILQPPALAA